MGRAIYAVWLRELLKFTRDRLRIVTSLVQPALWLFIMGGGLGSTLLASQGTRYQHFLFPGVIGMTLLFTALFSSISIVFDRQFGFLKEMLVAPVPRSGILIGKALAGATAAMIQGMLVLFFAPLLHIHIEFVGLLVTLPVMFFVAFALSALGILIAARMQSFAGFSAIMNFIVLPMYLLSGMIFPITPLPGWLRTLAQADPLAYGVDLIRGTLLHAQEFSLGLDAAILALFTIVVLGLSIRLFSAEA